MLISLVDFSLNVVAYTNVIKTFSGTARLICIDHDTENTMMMGSQWHCRHEGQARLHAVIKVPWLVVLLLVNALSKDRTVCVQTVTSFGHTLHIVLKWMNFMVVSSTTTLFSFLLVDTCFLSDLVMHPWSKLIMSIKNSQIYFKHIFFTIGTTLTPIHAYTGGHAYRHHPKKSYNHQTGAPTRITTGAPFTNLIYL